MHKNIGFRYFNLMSSVPRVVVGDECDDVHVLQRLAASQIQLIPRIIAKV